MKKIGIDASRSFTQNPTGTENYSYHIVESIAKIERPEQLVLFLRSNAIIPSAFPSRGRVFDRIERDRMWTQWGLMRKTYLADLDLLFVPAHVVPFLKNPKLPIVVTVHDIRREFLPPQSTLLQKVYLNPFIEKLRASLSTRIIAVSESTKKDLCELGVKEEKIEVIYEGVDQTRFNLSLQNDDQRLATLRHKYRLPQTYLLFVGTVQPRKNLIRLIRAFGEVKKDLAEVSVSLVIAGKRGWNAQEIYDLPSKESIANVQFIDYVDSEDLPYLYAGARCFVYPSLYEGFGLPILEALAVGKPVVTSNRASMPEVGGDLAIYIDPYEIESIAAGIVEGMGKELNLTEVAAHLSNFTWEKAGRETYQLFKEIIYG